MIRDILRAALVVTVLAVASALLVETRLQLASIDVAHRTAVHSFHCSTMPYPAPLVAPAQQPQPNRLRRLGQATLELADSALGIAR